jgi:signal transduction histidine kinase
MSEMLQHDAHSVEAAIGSFTQVLTDLQGAHDELTARAAHMEAELQIKVEELDRANAHLQAVLTALPTGVLVSDAEGHVVEANDVARELLGDDASNYDVFARLAGETQDTPLERNAADGTCRVVATRTAQVCGDNEVPLGHVLVLDDRTHLTRITERLHQQSKMAALGTMAGGIAHEIRNPMNAIRGFAGLLLRELDGETTAAKWASKIVEGSTEVDAIITSTLALAHPERLALETVNATELANQALEIARIDAEREGHAQNFVLEVHGDSSAVVHVDRLELRQALRNLLANAMQAQTTGGRVELTVASADHGVCFTVDDAGPGIPSELAARVSEPFFTTRAQGTGLGLALVHTIAQLHGGELTIFESSSPLGGARVQITIPHLESSK